MSRTVINGDEAISQEANLIWGAFSCLSRCNVNQGRSQAVRRASCVGDIDCDGLDAGIGPANQLVVVLTART